MNKNHLVNMPMQSTINNVNIVYKKGVKAITNQFSKTVFSKLNSFKNKENFKIFNSKLLTRR